MNFGAQLLVVVVAFICLPILVKLLSPTDFGLLSLLWAVIGYFTLFDFGISRAVTKLLASLRGNDDEQELSSIIWASLVVGTSIGLFGMLLLYVFSPVLMDVLNIDPGVYAESVQSFRAASYGIPFMVLYGIMRGIQAAYFKFTLMNLYQFLLGIIQWVGSVVVVLLGLGLYEIILCIVAGRMVVTMLSLMQLPSIAIGFSFKRFVWNTKDMRRLVNYGGWVSLSQILSPVFSYLDRFFIGRFVSIAAVGYYTIPSEMLSRILIIAMSLVTVLFPALSEYAKGEEQTEKMNKLYVRSTRFLFVALFPIIVILSLFSYEILSLWVGPTAADQAHAVFIILCVGIFFNSMAQIPTTLLHAIGKPRMTGLLNLIELPLLVAMNIVLIPVMGIVGAAIAWSVRVMIDCVVLIVLAERNIDKKTGERYFVSNTFLIAAFMFCGVCAMMIYLDAPSLSKFALAVVFGLAYATIVWIYALNREDKESLYHITRKLWMA